MEYDNIEDLHNAFTRGNVDLTTVITVGNKQYKQETSIATPLHEAIQQDKQIGVILRNLSEHVGDHIAMTWSCVDNLMKPSGCEFVDNTALEEREVHDELIIPADIEVTIPTLNDLKIGGKVDTGADMTSLHADDIQVQGDVVKFTCKPHSDMVFTAQKRGDIKVSTSEGDEVRSIILADIIINGKTIEGCEVNLNDREGMTTPLLIGMNVLSKGNFFVDTTTREPTPEYYCTIGSDDLQQLNEDNTPDTREIDTVVDTLLEHDYSLRDIVRNLKSRVIAQLND